jgi:hypothetical protein
MGGFQKYPIPRFLHVGHWVGNKNWRWNTFHVGAPLFFLSFLTWRNAMISTVKNLK